MPGMKGDEFLIKIHQRFPEVIKVMLTGQADEAAIERATQEANLHACLYKPWTEADLTQIITTAIN
jgi:response regulator RpfG family c-di-GMP phosphodiesterase